MEDCHVNLTDFNENPDEALFAVFDGHGGSAIAKFCGEHFPETFMAQVGYTNGDYGEGLRKSYLALDGMLVDPVNLPQLKKFADKSTPVYDSGGSNPVIRSSVHPALNSGCTAVSIHIKGELLTVANSGDSRAILCRNGLPVELTTDHKANLQSEIERITSAGGVVTNGRVYGSLNLTRAIGDLSFKSDDSRPPESQVITANPDIGSILLDPVVDDFIVIGCDGIFEVLKNSEIIDFFSSELSTIRQSPTATISDAIARLLDIVCSDDVGRTEGLGGDNLTCILVDLRPDRPLANTDRIWTEDGKPFELRPSSYEKYRLRRGVSNDSDIEFGDWESRVEKLG
jgi:protein phosphatase 1G